MVKHIKNPNLGADLFQKEPKNDRKRLNYPQKIKNQVAKGKYY